jgi:hypothetical protein
VWVIAETTDLPTKFVKIVVTDDRGLRAAELPSATYNVWVRIWACGFAETNTTPGKTLNLTAVVAPDAKSAANIIQRATGFRCSVRQRRASFQQGADQQRHSGRHENPGPISLADQVRQLHGVPCAGRKGHANSPKLCGILIRHKGLGSAA